MEGTGVAKATHTSDERRQALESWMDLYGAQVFHLGYTFYGNLPSAVDVYLRTFVLAYRHFDILRAIGDNQQAVIAMAVRACMTNAATATEASQVQDFTFLAEDVNFPDVQLPAADPLIDIMVSLPTEQKMVLLAAVFATSDLAVLSRMFLRPTRYIEALLGRALMQLPGGLSDAYVIKTSEDVRDHLAGVFANVPVPDWLRIRSSQQVRATLAQMNAERRHRGPQWLFYATIATCVFSVLAVGIGTSRMGSSASVLTSNQTSPQPVKGLPAPLENLPGNVLAQFELPSDFSLKNLDHMMISKDAVYLATLNQSTGKWPAIQISAYDFSATGSGISQAEKHIATVETTPPVLQSQNTQQTKTTNWVISDWQVHVSDAWAVLIVHWAEDTDKNTTVTQVYTLYLPSGHANLVKSIGPQKQPNESVVAAGDGKVIVQSSIQGNSAQGPKAIIGLPIDVYTLTGTTPIRALTGPTEISAPFGLMVHPILTGGTLVFQGIAGEPDDATATNATWYTLSWDGQLSRYAGPPLDGRPHWAVRGQDGKFWWCETTPDGTNQSNMQVLMAPLEDSSSAQQVAAQSLNGSVSFFTVSGESMAWVQTTNHVTQLVIESVQ
jgi:DNA-directed RNA polymerase specialized sigma24 family protein